MQTPQHIQEPIRALRVMSDEHACVYVPRRRARHEYLIAAKVDPEDYHRLMNMNYRRSGPVVYRPECPECRQCLQLRVPAEEFEPDRGQRRNLRMNADVMVRVAAPSLTPERWRLYGRYQSTRHDEHDHSPESLEEFLYTSCVHSTEWSYYLGDRLVMVGIADVSPGCLSAVYCYWEPALAGRGLGTLNVLTLLAAARAESMPHVYLGYYIRDCAKMIYKARFRPCEVLEHNRWRRL
jgi:arginine-tRNA-protein transferase